MKPHTGLAISADNYLIYIAWALALLACVAYLITAFIGSRKGGERVTSKIGRIAYYVSTGSAAGALLYLLQCILSGSRYDIAYVSDNSSLRDALLYRVSSLWAGQGGSMLLWAAFGGVIGLFLLKKLDRSSPGLLGFWCTVQAFFLTLLVVDDPMRKLVDFQAGTMGAGMNPLLKNPWMVIHPPVVFLAYALLAVPAAFAIQALIDGDATKWVKKCLPWAIGAWVAMTAGLVLGMIWSYEVLGWGGYWGWDPVENASLVPWLLITALVHGLVLQRQRGRMMRWNVVLAFAAFLSVIYATFLTRSGILSEVSVHAFGDSENFRAMPIYPWLKWVPIGYCALFIGFLVARWNVMSSPEKKPLATGSRDLAVSVGAIVVCLFALVVLVGTTFSTFSGSKDLQPSFYTTMSIPLALVAILFIALAPLMNWGTGDGRSRKEGRGLANVLLVLGAVVVVAVASVALSLGSPGVAHRVFGWLLPEGKSAIATGSLVLLIGTAFVALITAVMAVTKSSFWKSGVHVAHAGIALVIIGIVFSTTGKSSVIDLTERGKAVQAQGYALAYKSRRHVSGQKDVMNMTVERGGRRFDAPLAVISSDRGVTMFPFIKNSVLSDLYIAPDKIVSEMVTPYLSWNGKAWVTHPVLVTGSNATLALVGMQVEGRSVTLQYLKPGAKPVEFKLGDGEPANIDGYGFAFRGFASSGKDNMSSAGANIGVSGRGISEIAVVRVTTKPLMSLLWLGTVMIMVGGCLALINRRSARA